MDICYRGKEGKLLRFTLNDPKASKSSITARNDLWSASIIKTHTLRQPYPQNTHAQAHTQPMSFHIMHLIAESKINTPFDTILTENTCYM